MKNLAVILLIVIFSGCITQYKTYPVVIVTHDHSLKQLVKSGPYIRISKSGPFTRYDSLFQKADESLSKWREK